MQGLESSLRSGFTKDVTWGRTQSNIDRGPERYNVIDLPESQGCIKLKELSYS